MVKSRLRGGERVWSFEYRMPVGKERLGSPIPTSLLVIITLSITLCPVNVPLVNPFSTEATLSTEACETRRFAKEVVSSSR